MADGKVIYQIVGDTSQLMSDMKSAEGIIQQTASSWDGIAKAAAAAVGTAFTAAVAGGTASLTALGKEGLEYNNSMEKYQRSFTTFLGDGEKAADLMEEIADYAAVTPFDVDNLTQAVGLLVSANVPAEDALSTILALGDAISATGGSSDALLRMAANLQQVSNVGKASAMDVKQFAMAGVNIYQILADYTGESVENLKEMDISYDLISEALKAAAAEGGIYYGAMESQSETLTGKVETLKDTFSQFAGRVTEDLTPAAKDVVDALNNILSNSETIEPKIKGIFSGIADAVSEAANKVGDTEEIFGRLGEKVNTIKEKSEEMLPTVREFAGELLEKIAEKADSLIEKLSPLVEDILKSAYDTIVPMKPELEQIGNVILANIAKYVENLKSPLETIATSVLPILADNLPDVIELLKDIAENIILPITEALADLQPKLDHLTQAVMPSLSELIGKVVDFLLILVNDVAPPIIDFIIGIIDPLLEFAEDILPPLVSFVGSLLDILRELARSVLPPLLEHVKGIFEKLEPIASTILKDIIGYAQKIADKIGDFIEKISPIIDKVGEIGEAIAELLHDILEPLWGFLSEQLDSTLDDLLKILGIIVDILADQIYKALEDIQDGVKAVQDVFNILVTFMQGDFTTAWDMAMAFWQDSTQKAKDRIEGWINEAIEIVKKGAAVIKTLAGAIGGAIGGAIKGDIKWSDVNSVIVEDAKEGLNNIKTKDDVGWYDGDFSFDDPVSAAGGSTAHTTESGTSHGGGGTKIELNVTTELDGEVVARNTYSRLDDYIDSEVRG